MPGLFPAIVRVGMGEQMGDGLLLSKSFTDNVTAPSGGRQLHYMAEKCKKKSVLMQKGVLINNIYPLRTCA